MKTAQARPGELNSSRPGLRAYSDSIKLPGPFQPFFPGRQRDPLRAAERVCPWRAMRLIKDQHEQAGFHLQPGQPFLASRSRCKAPQTTGQAQGPRSLRRQKWAGPPGGPPSLPAALLQEMAFKIEHAVAPAFRSPAALAVMHLAGQAEVDLTRGGHHLACPKIAKTQGSRCSITPRAKRRWLWRLKFWRVKAGPHHLRALQAGHPPHLGLFGLLGSWGDHASPHIS